MPVYELLVGKLDKARHAAHAVKHAPGESNARKVWVVWVGFNGGDAELDIKALEGLFKIRVREYI